MVLEVVEHLVNDDQRTPSSAPIVSFMALSVNSPPRAEWQQPLQSGCPYESSTRDAGNSSKRGGQLPPALASDLVRQAIVGGAGMSLPPALDPPPGMAVVLLYVPLRELTKRSIPEIQSDLGCRGRGCLMNGTRKAQRPHGPGPEPRCYIPIAYVDGRALPRPPGEATPVVTLARCADTPEPSMSTDLDIVFDQLREAAETRPSVTSRQSEALRVPHRPLAVLLEEDLRRRARFIDSAHSGPEERWPLATPGHLLDALEDIAKRLRHVSGLRHTVALQRIARVAGYSSWEHARSEQDEFEAGAGDAFRDGLVIAVSEVTGPASGFIRDDGLLFLAARDLVHEYGQTDEEGCWGQLCTPSSVGPGAPNMMATRQMFLEAIGASYWRPNGCAVFMRYQRDVPEDLAAAQALAASLVGARGLHYIWLRGRMHTVRPLWD